MRATLTALTALALVAGAAHAQGNGKGNDRKAGGDGPAASVQGGGNGKSRGNADRGGGPGGGQAVVARQAGGAKERGNSAAREERGNSSARENRGNSGERGNANARSVARGQDGANRGRDSVAVDRRGGNDERGFAIARGANDVVRLRNVAAIGPLGLVTGCPPGLAKKNPPCVPPGQVRDRYVRYDRPDFWGLRLGGGSYRYDDGYLLRLGPDGRIGGYIPLLGGALAIGNPWPTYYEPVALPLYYEDYFGLGPYGSYRYADNVLYRVDPETAAITSIAALLTGDDFVVGQAIPAGYDVYNVPYAYRDRYYDTPDAWYRYSDGYVYQVDPETRLIAAAIELLAT